MAKRATRMNYAATVRILFMDEITSDGEAADAVSALLTERGIYDDAIKDWSYMSDGRSFLHPEPVPIPVDYDRDEDRIPGSESMDSSIIALVRQLARMDPPDEHEEIAEILGEIEAFSHMIRKAREIVGEAG